MENVIMKKSGRAILAIVSIVCMILMFWTICDCFPKNITNTDEILKYNVQEKIDYNVHLDENEYYSDEYSNSKNMYVASLVDSLNVTFGYELNANKFFNGVYSYNISAVLSGRNNGEEVWNKTSEIFKSADYDSTDTSNVYLEKNVNISLKEYYQEAIKYNKLTGFPVILTIKINVENDMLVKGESEYLNAPSEFEISMPITDKTFSVTTTNNKNINKKVSFAQETKTSFNSRLFILATIAFIALIPVAIMSLCSLFNISNYDEYNRRMKEIKKNYGSYLYVDKHVPVFRRKEIIEVKTIEKVYNQLDDNEYITMFEKEKGSECWFYAEKKNEVYLYILSLEHRPINLSDNSKKRKHTKKH